MFPFILPIFRSIGRGSVDYVLFTVSAFATVTSHDVGLIREAHRRVSFTSEYTTDEVIAINCSHAFINKYVGFTQGPLLIIFRYTVLLPSNFHI